MALLTLKCPNCREKIQVEETMKKGFCMYCGVSFLVQDEIQRFRDEDAWGYHASKRKQRKQKYRDQTEPFLNVLYGIIIIIAVITIICMFANGGF